MKLIAGWSVSKASLDLTRQSRKRASSAPRTRGTLMWRRKRAPLGRAQPPGTRGTLMWRRKRAPPVRAQPAPGARTASTNTTSRNPSDISNPVSARSALPRALAWSVGSAITSRWNAPRTSSSSCAV